MRYLFVFTTFFLLFITEISFSQVQMDTGFQLLEKGNFKEAKVFFESVLQQVPDNKTAKLCYGRAVGLSGNPEKATGIFTELLTTYPNDFEIQLNYAESLLWNNKFTDAKEYYEQLLLKDNQSFPAVLGYANTLSNLKMYDEALINVNKALEISPGNPNALTSKKYIRLGNAYQLQQQKQLEESVTVLQQNLTDFPGDRATLSQIANVFIIKNDLENAEKSYLNLSSNKIDSIISLNGLSLVKHLQTKNKKALELSENAMLKIENIDNASITKQTKERYIQALIWNKKFKKAELEITNLKQEFPNKNWVLALSATQHTYKSNFKKSIEDYVQIMQNDSTSFDGNLGIANVYFADKNYQASFDAAHKTLTFFPEQKDALQLIKKLHQNFTPFIEQRIAYSFDSGDNKSFTSQTNLTYPLSLKLEANAGFSFKQTENPILQNDASSNYFTAGLNYLLSNRIYLKSLFGINSVSSSTDSYQQFLMRLSARIKPANLQDLEIGYLKKLEDFNADLLARKIVSDNYFLEYNLNTNFNLGWFTQYLYTTQNDNNTRHLLFTSLYYKLMEQPVLKTGLNYQFISFKDQVPTIYFSPETFHNMEVFAEILKDVNAIKPKNWYYHFLGASGIQIIESNDSQFTYRIQGKLGYKFSDRVNFHFYGQHTNIASATTAGFTFTEFGVYLKWYLASKSKVFHEQTSEME